MLNYIKAFSVFLIWVTIALVSHYYISNNVFNNCNSSESPESEYIINKNLYILDAENDTVFKFSKGFLIKQNNSSVSSSASIPNLKDSIFSFLKNHYSKELHIIGKYLNTEINNSENLNLGLQRAENVKNEFVNEGINSYQMKIFGQISEYFYNNDSIYENGITLNLKNANSKAIDSIENAISNKTLYIAFEKDKIILNDSLKDYAFMLKQYLNKNPNKKINITGHTDNIGEYEINLIIGLYRANMVKQYLMDNCNLTSKNITTFSKGEFEPIADKSTAEGRTKNRRIEIKIY